MLNEGDRVRMDNGIEGTILLLYPNGGSVLVKPDRQELPTVLLPRVRVTKIPGDPNQPR